MTRHLLNKRTAVRVSFIALCAALPMACETGTIGGETPDDNVLCSVDSDCPMGQYCDLGYCATGFDPGTGGSGGGPGCADVEVVFEPVVPTVMLLIDQSGSMTASYPGGSRWTVLYDALMNPSDGVVKALEDEVVFGLALYTSYDGAQGGTCPALTEASIALGNHAAIDAVYGPAGPEDETPTGESLLLVADALAATPSDGPRVIILATDGEPDTCAVPNPQTGQAVAIAAAEDAFDQGIKTFVLGVGNEVGEAHLQDMANAGVGLPVGGTDAAPYYLPQTKQELVDAFRTIIDGERSCVLSLDGEVDPAHAGEGTVYLDGTPLTYDDPNGWRLNGPSEIELLGTACETIKSGAHSVTGTFSCQIISVLR